MRPLAPFLAVLQISALAVLASPAMADQATPGATPVHATTARSGGAGGFAITSRKLDDGFRVEVLDAGEDNANRLRVGLTDGQTYWTASQTLDAVTSSCGAGKCVTTAMTRESIDESDGIAWVRFDVVTEVDHNNPDAEGDSDHDFTTHTTAVMGCKLPHDKVAPRCAWFAPQVMQSSHVDIFGTTLKVTTATGTVDTVELSFG